MTTNHKPKKNEKTMYVYDMASNFPTKKSISGGWGSIFIPMRSKTHDGGPKAAEEGRAGAAKVAGSRKSLSSTTTSSSNKILIEERRSSVSHVHILDEGKVGTVASLLQVKVLVSDMPGFMQVHAFRCARTTYDSLDKFSSKHMAYHMKKEFDKVYGPAWHCIVGSSFGSFITHSTGCFLYFSMEKLFILVFKTKVQRADNDLL